MGFNQIELARIVYDVKINVETNANLKQNLNPLIHLTNLQHNHDHCSARATPTAVTTITTTTTATTTTSTTSPTTNINNLSFSLIMSRLVLHIHFTQEMKSLLSAIIVTVCLWLCESSVKYRVTIEQMSK